MDLHPYGVRTTAVSVAPVPGVWPASVSNSIANSAALTTPDMAQIATIQAQFLLNINDHKQERTNSSVTFASNKLETRTHRQTSRGQLYLHKAHRRRAKFPHNSICRRHVLTATCA